MSSLNRREFLSAGAATTAAAVIPRHVLGGVGYVAPSDQVSIAYIGCGTQGIRQLIRLFDQPQARVVAVCDPNTQSDDYPEWFPGEVNGKVRAFLDDPEWARSARGGLCGREVARHMVDTFHARGQTSGSASRCRSYADFRELLAEERDLDGVYIMTPEHLHATIAIHAMRSGRHVVQHKALANVLAEARLSRDTAVESGLATHMFCSADNEARPTITEWIRAGAIGPVREVHNWSSRPFWPQGMTRRPVDKPPVPEGFDWDLWLGPVPDLPYHPTYTHAVFRGWYDFGTGALGDMGHYSFFQIFKILDLGYPVSVEASRSQFWDMADFSWHKENNVISFPRASTITWEFEARGDMPPVRLHWYDGGLRPALLDELEANGEQMPEEGLLFVGEDGKLLANFSGGRPRLIPDSRMQAFEPPPETLPRPIDEIEQWLRACQGGPPADANFEAVYPMAETILLGTIALRHDGKLHWDSAAMAFADAPDADALLRRTYREGWDL